MQCEISRHTLGWLVVPFLFGLIATVLAASLVSPADAAPRKPAAKKPTGKFKVGDRASWKFGNDEFPGVVTKINDQGWVTVKFDDPSKFGGEHFAPPDQFQKLAKPKAKTGGKSDAPENPFDTAEERAEKSGPRTWSDRSGKFKIEATLLKFEDGKVTLKRTDGKEVTMPLEKLSDDDQRFLTGEDPAEGDAGEAPVSETTAAGARPVDISRSSKWTYEPDGGTAADLRGGRFMLGKMEFAEQVSEIFFSPEKEKVIAVTKLNFFEKKRSRVFVCDLKRGKLENAGEFAASQVPLAMSSDMSRVVSGPIDDHGKRDTLTLYDVDGQKVKPRTAWRPYGHEQHQANVAWAKFVDQDHLLTANDAGTIVLWDLSSGLEAEYQIAAKGNAAKPAFSPTMKYMAVKAEDGIVLIETLSGKRVGFLPLEGVHFGGQFAIGRSGTQLAAINGSRVRIWDLMSRELINEFDVSGAWGNQSLDWVDDECLLADGKFVIDVPHRVIIWVYAAVSMGRLYGNHVWFVEGGDQPLLAAGVVPPPEAKRLVANIDRDSMLMIKPGETVSIDAQLSSYPQHRDKILQDLQRQLEANGMRIGEGGPLKVVVSIKPGVPQKVEYRRFGSFQNEVHQVNVQETTVEVLRDGKRVWTSGGNAGAPHLLHLNQGETIDQGIQRHIESAVANAGNVALPKYYAVLPTGKAAGKSKAPESD